MHTCRDGTLRRSPAEAGASARAGLVGICDVVTGAELLDDIVQHGATGTVWTAIVAGCIAMSWPQHGWLAAVDVPAHARHKNGSTPEMSTSKAATDLSQRYIDPGRF